MRIVVLDGYALNPGDLSWDGLATLGELVVHDRTEGEDEIVARSEGAEVVLTNKAPLRRAVIERLPGLKYIGVLATGYEIVDTAAADASAIVVTNVPAYSTDSVAQMVFAHVLHHCQHVASHTAEAVRGVWSQKPDFCYWNAALVELAGLTMGVVGFGQIGRKVAEIAHAFGMRVIVHSRSENNAPPWPDLDFTTLSDLMSRSDVVTLHCPLTEHTRGLVNRQTLALMKPNAILVNTGRGPLVVAADLAEALNSGLIAGAGLDVMDAEPPSPDNPLLSARNCSITPHIAWATLAARQRLLTEAQRNITAYLNGSPRNVVNQVNQIR